MEQIAQYFEQYGAAGLFFLSFIESFISPILPDLLLIPMALAAPQNAIYYAVIATVASVIGGYIGYGIGRKFGFPIMRKYVPDQHAAKIQKWLEVYGGWAVFGAAMAPIPYKFVSISAGVFRVNMMVFTIASIFGRAKRFLLEGVLIFYFGPKALELMNRYSDDAIIWTVVLLGILGIGKVLWTRSKKKGANDAGKEPLADEEF